MIRFVLSQRPDGADVATCDAYAAASRNGATMALARQLVAPGFPDQPVEAVGTDGRIRFTAPSLHRLAQWTVIERDRGGIAFERYQRNPHAVTRPTMPDGAERQTATEITPTG